MEPYRGRWDVGGVRSVVKKSVCSETQEGCAQDTTKQDVSTDTVCAPKSLQGQVPALGMLNMGAERCIRLRCVTFHLWQ